MIGDLIGDWLKGISIPIWLILCFGTFAILIWKAAQFIKGMDEGGLAICN